MRRTPATIRRTSAFLGLLVALALIVDGAVTLLDVAARASYTTNASYSSVKRLDVALDQGRVELVRAPRGSRLSIRARITGGLASPRIRRTYADGKLKLNADCPGFLVISCGVRWRLGVPDGTAVSVAASSGDVAVDGVRARGLLKVRSSDGSIDVSGAGVRRVDAASSDGDVHVDLADTPVTVKATSSDGDVDVDVPDVPYAITATTSDGDRKVDATDDPKSRRTIVVRSADGDVHVSAHGR